MDFSINPKNNLNDELALLAKKLHLQALGHFKNADVHYVIHELRKRFKELRGYYRLIREDIGEEQFDKYNKFYRDLGHRITWIRDIKVFHETFEKIRALHEDKIYKNAFSKTETHLDNLLKSTEGENDIKGILTEIKKELKEFTPVPEGLKAGDPKKKNIIKSIKTVYQEGHTLYKAVKESPSVENFHEWRKTVKYLSYQLSIMQFLWPAMMKAYEEAFSDLADILGDDHDIAVLFSELEKNLPDEDELKLLKALFNDQQSILRKKAVAIGSSLFFDKPNHFAQRIKAYWLAHETTYP